MYSHMCQDLAEGEMRRWGWLRGWQSKRSRICIDADRRTRSPTLHFAWARQRKTRRRFFLSPRKVSTQIWNRWWISHMDVYANLGGDEDILWGFEWALWWCKLKRRPLNVKRGALLHMHWGRSKPFPRSHIYIAISAELWEPGNLVFGLFLNKESLVEVFFGSIKIRVKEVPFASWSEWAKKSKPLEWNDRDDFVSGFTSFCIWCMNW